MVELTTNYHWRQVIAQTNDGPVPLRIYASPGSVFCLLLGVSPGCAFPITGQVTSVTWPVIG